MKIMKISCLIFTACLMISTIKAQGYCLKYPQFNEELQFKYCGSAIQWPVSTTKMLDDSLHDDALIKYKAVYQEYIKDPSNKNQYTGITVDCLGIIRKAYCAHFFPYCIADDPSSEEGKVYIGASDGLPNPTLTGDEKVAAWAGKSSPGVCKSLCSFIEARCTPFPEIFETVCANQRNDNCAKCYWMQMTMLLGLILVNLVW